MFFLEMLFDTLATKQGSIAHMADNLEDYNHNPKFRLKFSEDTEKERYIRLLRAENPRMMTVLDAIAKRGTPDERHLAQKIKRRMYNGPEAIRAPKSQILAWMQKKNSLHDKILKNRVLGFLSRILNKPMPCLCGDMTIPRFCYHKFLFLCEQCSLRARRIGD